MFYLHNVDSKKWYKSEPIVYVGTDLLDVPKWVLVQVSTDRGNIYVGSSPVRFEALKISLVLVWFEILYFCLVRVSLFRDDSKPIKVLSIRGNHDSFNELDLSQSHYVQNLKNESISTHLHTIEKSYGNYSLLSVDAAPNPGFKRPFNFVGYISDQSKLKLETLGNEAKNNNQTVLYGHYPTSSKFSHFALMAIFELTIWE